MNTDISGDGGAGGKAIRNQLVRFAWIGSGLFLLFMVWDTLIGFVLHLLFYVIEFLELWLEGSLELLFQMEGHEAQMFTAWIGLACFLVLGGYGYAMLKRSLRKRFRSWSSVQAWFGQQFRNNWVVFTLLAAGYLASLLLF